MVSYTVINVALLISIAFIYVISKKGRDLEIWIGVCKFNIYVIIFQKMNMDASIKNIWSFILNKGLSFYSHAEKSN